MSTTYAGNASNYPTSITIPSDGDGPGIAAADVNAAFEGLADRTAFLEARSSPNVAVMPAQGIIWVRSTVGTPHVGDGIYVVHANTDIEMGAGSAAVKLLTVNTGAATAKGYRVPLSRYLPHGATLSSASAKIQGASGHAALPALLPSFGLLRTSISGTAGALLSDADGLIYDAPASVAAYQAAHDIVFTPDQNNVIDLENYSYDCVLFNEGHTNALANLIFYSVKLTLT